MSNIEVTCEDKIAALVRRKLANADSAHRFDHVQVVVAMAKYLCSRESGDPRIAVPAAYFHDYVSRNEVAKNADHTNHSAQAAEEALLDLKYARPLVDKIVQAIKTSSYEAHLAGIEPVSIDGAIVRDADWLEAIGARGIARACCFGGAFRLPLATVDWNPEHPIQLPMDIGAADPSVMYHFFSKLLWINGKLLTKTARDIGSSRHSFMVTFLQRYKHEMEGSAFQSL